MKIKIQIKKKEIFSNKDNIDLNLDQHRKVQDRKALKVHQMESAKFWILIDLFNLNQ